MKNVLIVLGVLVLIAIGLPAARAALGGSSFGGGGSGRHGIGEWHGASFDYGSKFERGYPLYGNDSSWNKSTMDSLGSMGGKFFGERAR